ncbi:hypothetical protein MHU86_25547 [Fragilaria crotonensis]|nr:hypothetical protein MHU86_25547 [Fragilaria crotonensis]
MNIDTDYLATRYRLRGKLKSSPHVDHVPEQRISISILGVRLTSQYDECIRYHINGYHLKRYMQERKDWDEHTWNTIDLGSFGQHFKRLTPSEQTSLMTLVHDQLPLGKRQYQVSQSKEAALKKCPCCADADEDPTHLLHCQAPNAFMVPAGLTALRRSSAGRSHPFRRILVDGINTWIVSGKSSF